MRSPSGEPAKAQTSVAVVDDDAIVRSWVRLSLRHTEFRFAGEASTMREAMDLIERRRPELLVVDYRLPDGRGTELIRSLRRLGITTPVLVITAAPQVGLNEEVREAGGQGVVRKRADTAGLLADLRKVASGGSVVDHEHPRRPRSAETLTRRELEVLSLAAAGSTNPEIAAQLGIGRETVKTLLRRSYRKLGAHNRVGAIALAYERGLISQALRPADRSPV